MPTIDLTTHPVVFELYFEYGMSYLLVELKTPEKVRAFEEEVNDLEQTVDYILAHHEKTETSETLKKMIGHIRDLGRYVYMVNENRYFGDNELGYHKSHEPMDRQAFREIKINDAKHFMEVPNLVEQFYWFCKIRIFDEIIDY